MMTIEATHTTMSRQPASARPVRRGTQWMSPDVGDFLVVFRQREHQLAPAEMAELRRWVQSWLRIDRPCYVVMGCCTDTAQTGRVRRLHALRDQLAACGVPADMVRYTDESIEPPLHATTEELPQDFVWLKAIDLAKAERTVRSIRSMFEVGSLRRMADPRATM